MVNISLMLWLIFGVIMQFCDAPTRHLMGCQARVSHFGTGTLQPFLSQS